jgi:hypothetical protein
MADGSHFEPLMSCPLAVQPVLYIGCVQLALHAKRAPEGAPSLGESEALERRMQPCATPGKHRRRVGDDSGVLGDDPQK